MAQAEKAEHARQLAQTFLRILNLHRVEFPPAQPPVAPAPPRPDRAAIYKDYEQQALTGIGVFNRSARAEAKQRAEMWTENELNRLRLEAYNQRTLWQQYLNQRWYGLCHNDSAVVIETLAEAFDDNEAPAAAVGVEDSEASLALLVWSVNYVVPEQMPTTTQAGNLSLKKLPQRDRADYYKQYVCGQTLVTVREAFAVAPALTSVRVVVLRNDGQDVYGHPSVSCVLAARFGRQALAGVRWESADAVQIVNAISSECLMNQAGRSKEIAGIDLSDEPNLRALIDAVDLAELMSTR